MNLKGTTAETAAILKAGVRKYQGLTFERTIRTRGIFQAGRKGQKKAADIAAGLKARTEKADKAINDLRTRFGNTVTDKVQSNWGLNSSRATTGRALADEG